jgi:hypothetical protein
VDEGVATQKVVASYVRLLWRSNPTFAKGFEFQPGITGKQR